MSHKIVSLAGSALFLLVAPGTFAGLIPWLITRWTVQRPALASLPVRAAGALLTAIAVVILLESFARFALTGLGTPAPVMPTRHLVVSGFYRYVRNPMYVAVTALVLGQALLFGSPVLLVYAALLWAVFHLFVIGYEEPVLRRQYGPEYDWFCAHVPRWLPRLRPWRV
jgi:protein-S-isoprenylcysteine O-methyltransferase Ste14